MMHYSTCIPQVNKCIYNNLHCQDIKYNKIYKPIVSDIFVNIVIIYDNCMV